MVQSNAPTIEVSFLWLDRSGQAALLASSLVVLITFFTSFSHVDIPAHESVSVNQQIGIPLRNETAQLKIENARLAALESKLDSLLLSADSSSPIPPATDCN
jgi:hypothetical protein